MKKKHTWLIAPLVGLTLSISSCIDQIAFGNAFLEKAPGGDVTEDTVFNSAEYARQYLNSMYSWQYYGLPWSSDSGSFPYGHSYWTGSISYITDLYQISWSSCEYYKRWYSGAYTSGDGYGKSKREFVNNNVWYTVRAGWKLMDHIADVPGMSDAEKKEMVAQAKCLMADGYYDLFRHYGGLPLVKSAFKGTEGTYDVPRATVEETVKFIVQLLDEAAPDLPWGYDASNTASDSYDNAENDMGHWTRAGAKALKAKVLLFAASPLLNSAQAYAGGTSEAEQQHLVWYGGYKQEIWDQCYDACKDFFDEFERNGYYRLEQASGSNPTSGQYRIAFRHAYYDRDSKEIIHSTRITSSDFTGNYFNAGLYNNNRIGLPTLEYMKMFAWADGRPFDWDQAKAEDKLDEAFVKWKNPNASYNASDAILTRDPRLYESIIVNGVPRSVSSSGQMSGDPYEIWVSGRDAGTDQEKQNGRYGTGFSNNKFIIDGGFKGIPVHWPTLRLSDLYLTYAEAKLQSKNDHAGAIELINKVRARVGLGGLVECNPDKNLLSDKDALLDLLLNERACELGFEDSRFYDMIRYKRKADFEKTLHILRTYRLDSQGNVVKERWYGDDKNAGKPFPSSFQYEVTPITTGARVWWTEGFEPKWYLSAIKLAEVEKGYLVQNPGW